MNTSGDPSWLGSECCTEPEAWRTVMKKEKCTAIVLAAGQGRRMGTKIQKQYLHIQDRPVVYYALESFQKSDIIDEIILVTGEKEIGYCKEGDRTALSA